MQHRKGDESGFGGCFCFLIIPPSIRINSVAWIVVRGLTITRFFKTRAAHSSMNSSYTIHRIVLPDRTGPGRIFLNGASPSSPFRFLPCSESPVVHGRRWRSLSRRFFFSATRSSCGNGSDLCSSLLLLSPSLSGPGVWDSVLAGVLIPSGVWGHPFGRGGGQELAYRFGLNEGRALNRLLPLSCLGGEDVGVGNMGSLE